MLDKETGNVNNTVSLVGLTAMTDITTSMTYDGLTVKTTSSYWADKSTDYDVTTTFVVKYTKTTD